MMTGTAGFCPAGLSVLVVDADSSCREDLQNILNKYYYQVKTSVSALVAAEMLQNERFDMVISDVNMTDIMDGFQFIRYVANKEIPIIMMSGDEDTDKVMKGVQHGACDYLLKPIESKDIQFIWQHVYRKRIYQIEAAGGEGSHTTEIGMNGLIAINKRGGESGGVSSSHVKISPKKPRVVWTEELKMKFEKALEKAVETGGNNIGPKIILELMGDKSLTRDNVASYLQKHRKRNAEKDVENLQQPPVFLPNRNMHQTINENGGPSNSQCHEPPVFLPNRNMHQIVNENGGHSNSQVFNHNNNYYQGLNQNGGHDNFQIENPQVVSRINHYQGLNQNFQINSSNQQVQSESRTTDGFPSCTPTH